MRTRCLLLFALTSAPALAAGEHSHGHRAHRHGVADLQAVLEGNELHVRVAGPADNLLGFEHAPRTEAQHQAVRRAEQLLKQPQRLITLPAAAACEAQPPRVQIKLPVSGSRERHSDFEAEYRWRCAAPSALRHIDVALFEAFTHMQELRAQAVTASGQRSTRLKRGAARLTLAP